METATPEQVGLSAKRLERIRPVMQRYVDRKKLAGVLTLVARRGKIAHLECFGMMDLEAGKPMQADALFRLYSMTKPITSVAVMMLYEEGRFQLYDPVSNYIPELTSLKVKHRVTAKGLQLVDAERDMTVRDLLTHTSGLTYDTLEESPIGDMYRQVDPLNATGTLKEMVVKLAQLPLVHLPGSAWRYGVSTDVLGYLVEVVSGMPFEQFLERRLFQPLGMHDTAFYVPKEKIDRLSANYGLDTTGSIKLIDAPATSTFLSRSTPPHGGDGLVSTAADYLRFCQMLLDGGEIEGARLLSRKTVELMTANHLPDHLVLKLFKGMEHLTTGYGFGLGFRVLLNVAEAQTLASVGEYGWTGAASTVFFIDPKEELIGLLLPQLLPMGTYPVDREFHTLVYQAIAD